MQLPCGKCLGCREAKAKAWSLRCQLEMKEHKFAVFTTLTYRPDDEPVTLNKRHLKLFLKRLRKRSGPARIRFFAAGEYGERNGRPHYHSIIFGMEESSRGAIQAAWPHGHAHTVRATPATIAYTAGYAAKKYGEEQQAQEERVDPTTGEVYNYQPPFIQMSRKPGIGGIARNKYSQSWRLCAVLNGQKQGVPRYLHEGWKAQATPIEKEQLDNEKNEIMKQIVMTEQQRKAAELIAIKKQEMKGERRKI